MIAASAKLLLQTLTSPGQGETAIFGIWCLELAHTGLTANIASVHHIRQINAVEPQILFIEMLQQLHTVAICQWFVAIARCSFSKCQYIHACLSCYDDPQSAGSNHRWIHCQRNANHRNRGPLAPSLLGTQHQYTY